MCTLLSRLCPNTNVVVLLRQQLASLTVLSILHPQGDSFSGATDMFKDTIGKIGNMISSGNQMHMTYLVLFVVVVFLIIYFMMGKK
jgi:hypothetical protein